MVSAFSTWANSIRVPFSLPTERFCRVSSDRRCGVRWPPLTTTTTPADRNVVDGAEVRFPPSLPRALQKRWAPPRFTPYILRLVRRNWKNIEHRLKGSVTRTQRWRGECTYSRHLDPVHWLKCSTNRTLTCSARQTTASGHWPWWTSRWWSWFSLPCTRLFHLLPEMFWTWKKSAGELWSALPALERGQLSPFLPPFTLSVMAVNCQVGAQEEELSRFYSQVATALQAEAASEQQRASCPERGMSRRLHFPFKPQTECATRWSNTYDGGKHRGAE